MCDNGREGKKKEKESMKKREWTKGGPRLENKGVQYSKCYTEVK